MPRDPLRLLARWPVGPLVCFEGQPANQPTGRPANRPTEIVDVRDLLCAQALALVAQAMRRLPVGGRAEVLVNAEDVTRDVLAWATQEGHAVRRVGGSALDIERLK